MGTAPSPQICVCVGGGHGLSPSPLCSIFVQNGFEEWHVTSLAESPNYVTFGCD